MSVAMLIVILLAGGWSLLVGDFSPGQLLLGLLFGALFVALSGAGRGATVAPAELPRRAAYLLFFLLFLLPRDVVRSNFQMARRLLRRKPDIRPAIIREPAGESGSFLALGLEEHAITLSPGQALVDYSADEQTAYVHVIDHVGATEASVGLWRRYREILDKVFT